MLEVERFFSSSGRIKVMGIVLESNELNISEITRRSGISHSSVSAHLEFLVEAGMLTEKRFNRIRIFRVNRSNPYAEILQRFMADWKSLDAPQAVGIGFN
jgi:DNA-binding transcriptional ArsR family regulator